MFPDHLETYLGRMESGQMYDVAEVSVARVSVARFAGQPMEGAATYVTAGLSKVHLHQPSGHIRQELLFAQEGEREPFEAAHILASLAEHAIETRAALPRGQIVGPAGPVVDGSVLESFVALHPAYFPEGLERYDDPDHDVPILVVMLLPVSHEEVAFIREKGLDAFQDLVVAEDPNLLDWRRPSLL